MIEIKNVSFKYKNQKEVLNNISLSINHGEIVSIIGKNGTGKSTFAKIIAGILKPTQGNITIDGLDVHDKKNYKAIRKKVGIVFQNPDNQILFSKVYDDVEFALKNLKVEDRDIKIKESLKLVEMDDYENADTFKLSLGQKQRVNIASAIAIQPDYLILDEPTTMIDSKGKEKIYKIIERIKEDKKTIIYITNNMNEILLSDKVIVIGNNKIEDVFPSFEIFKKVNLLEKMDICIPDIIKLVLVLKEKGLNIELKNYTIESLANGIIEVLNK